MKKWLLNRFREPSTWRGIIMLLTAVGVALTPEQTEAVITVGIAVVGAIGVFTSDPVPSDGKPLAPARPDHDSRDLPGYPFDDEQRF